MQARDLIHGTAYSPEVLSVAFEAFNRAWSEIVGYYEGGRVEQARSQLAHAVLEVASKTSTDPEKLKQAALRLIAFADAG